MVSAKWKTSLSAPLNLKKWYKTIWNWFQWLCRHFIRTISDGVANCVSKFLFVDTLLNRAPCTVECTWILNGMPLADRGHYCSPQDPPLVLRKVAEWCAEWSVDLNHRLQVTRHETQMLSICVQLYICVYFIGHFSSLHFSSLRAVFFSQGINQVPISTVRFL